MEVIKQYLIPFLKFRHKKSLDTISAISYIKCAFKLILKNRGSLFLAHYNKYNSLIILQFNVFKA